MGDLVGNKLCIDSLHKDILSLSTVIGSVSSRIGGATWPSWKFPDQAAGDVDISELLTLYEYDEEFPEENNLAHVMLLELVIDRLVVFIQSMSKFIDQNISLNSTRIPSAQDIVGSSIGGITKKLWLKLINVQSTHQQMHSDSKSQMRRLKELQGHNSDLEKELAKYHEGVTQVSHTPSGRPSSGTILPPLVPVHREEIAKDNSNKSSQTYETAFVPCESCHKVQSSLKGVAKSMTQLCKSQGLQCSISKYMKQLKGLDWYSANDMARWEVEQVKDCERINTHLSDLMSTIEPLKEQLADSIKTCRKLEHRVEECQKDINIEKENQSILQSQHVEKVSSLNKQHEEVKTELTRKQKSLQEEKEKLEKRLKETKHEYEIQCSKYNELDEVKQQLMKELEESKTNNAEVLRLESILNSMESELSNAKQDVLDKETQLSQEQAITKSLTKRTESLQSKYDSILRRIDEMDDENNSLQQELSTLEEQNEQLQISLNEAKTSGDLSEDTQTTLDRIEKEKKTLKEIIRNLDTKVELLEKDLQQMKEQERLMVEYPDLNGPVNPNVSGTGDIATDMSNQVQANEVRIRLLDQQNNSMRATIEKLQKRTQSNTAFKSVEPTKPTQLWSQPNSLPETSSHSSPLSNGSRKDRPRSGNTQNTANSMSAYMKLKKSGMLDKPTPHKQATDSSSYCCPNCDKLYHTSDDYKLHQSYCARR